MVCQPNRRKWTVRWGRQLSGSCSVIWVPPNLRLVCCFCRHQNDWDSNGRRMLFPKIRRRSARWDFSTLVLDDDFKTAQSLINGTLVPGTTGTVLSHQRRTRSKRNQNALCRIACVGCRCRAKTWAGERRWQLVKSTLSYIHLRAFCFHSDVAESDTTTTEIQYIDIDVKWRHH